MKVTSRLISNIFDEAGRIQEIWNYQIENERIVVSLTNYGCTILKICSHDRNGAFGDVVLGYDQFEYYFSDPYYMNGLVGRYAGRIKNASYSLDGKIIDLEKNTEGGHQLHGGPRGLNRVVWQCSRISNAKNFIEFKHVSPERDQGHPGTLKLTAKFELNDNTLSIEHSATSDRATHVNLTQHIYFNLSASGVSSQEREALKLPVIDNHLLMLQSSRYLETDHEVIPTGRILDVSQTDFDFRALRSLGTTILDTFFLFDEAKKEEIQAKLIDPVSGRSLQIRSNQPGLQVYTSEYLSDVLPAKRGSILGQRAGLCLELQGFPNAPNQFEFPSTLLPAGLTKIFSTSYTFGVED